MRWMARVKQHRDALGRGKQIAQRIESLGRQLAGEVGHPGHVAARPS
jgi:hypothetical protein